MSFRPRDLAKKLPRLKGSVGADLQGLAQDRAIITDPEETRRRRTIRLTKRGNAWGFTLQTYGIRNKLTREIEVMSYVDYVEIQGPAWVAGMRKGDIILSVNGESVENSTHRDLVAKIQRSGAELRLVVLFEDCCKKVELHERYLKLKKVLSQKMKELKDLEEEERRISQGIPLSRTDNLRHSTCSSISSEWNIYSELSSPAVIDNLPANQFVFRNLSQSESDLSSSGEMTNLQLRNQTRNMNMPPTDLPETISIEDGIDTEDDNSSRGFLHSSSDISEASDVALRELYNITRGAQRISDITRFTHDQDGSEVQKALEDGRLAHLVENRGREISNEGMPKSGGIGDRQGSLRNVFYIESDSEDSVVSGELERNKFAQMSFSSATSVSTISSGSSSVTTRSSHSSNGGSSSSGVASVDGSDVGNNGADEITGPLSDSSVKKDYKEKQQCAAVVHDDAEAQERAVLSHLTSEMLATIKKTSPISAIKEEQEAELHESDSSVGTLKNFNEDKERNEYGSSEEDNLSLKVPNERDKQVDFKSENFEKQKDRKVPFTKKDKLNKSSSGSSLEIIVSPSKPPIVKLSDKKQRFQFGIRVNDESATTKL